MLSKDFILAGDAVFTIELPEAAAAEQGFSHRTYWVQHVEGNDRWPESWFVKLLTGPDNSSDFTYMGKLNPNNGDVMTTHKSPWPGSAFVVRLLVRVLQRVWADDHAAFEQHGYKLHHEGKCGRCGRRLTVPASVESGIGPECAKIMAEVAAF